MLNCYLNYTHPQFLPINTLYNLRGWINYCKKCLTGQCATFLHVQYIDVHLLEIINQLAESKWR